jgi:capsid protein
MSERFFEDPILNSPYECPSRHWELDADGDPIAIHISSARDRYLGRATAWKRWPIWGPDGQRNVLHLALGHHPEAVTGTGLLAPVLDLLNVHSGTVKAYVIAKQIQSCYPIIIKTDDPQLIAKAMAAKCYIGPESNGVKKFSLRPGRVYVVNRNADFNLTDLKYNGADMEAFTDAILSLACAAIGYPPQIVLKQLSKANLASARAAIAQGFEFTLTMRQKVIDYLLAPLIGWMIRELADRGTWSALDGFYAGNHDRLTAGIYEGALLPSPDPYKDALRAVVARDELGASPSTSLRMIGLNFESETLQSVADEAFAAQYGRQILRGEGASARSPAATAAAALGQDDDDDDDEDDDDDDDDQLDQASDARRTATPTEEQP